MYNETSRFQVVDRNYDVVQTITGWYELARLTQDYIKKKIVGNSFNYLYPVWEYDRWYENLKWVKAPIEYIIYNEYDCIVRVEDIREVEVKSRWEDPRWKRNNNWRSRSDFRFRIDPVPHTGKGMRNTGYNVGRKRQYMNEVRQSYGNEEYIRPKRTHGIGVVSGWDDEYRGDIFNKYSWKKNKKRKQWM